MEVQADTEVVVLGADDNREAESVPTYVNPGDDSSEDDQDLSVQEGDTVRVIFDFDNGDEGTLAVREGERLIALAAPDPDGWLYVRKGRNKEGFVPANYVEKEDSK